MSKQTISINTPKNTGKCFATLFRSLLIECDETVKVIGFNLEGSSSFLPGKNVIDSINLSQALADLTIEETNPHMEYPTTISFNFTKELRSSDLSSNDFRFLEDVPLIQTVDNEVRKITLVLAKSSGLTTSHSARNIISNLGVDSNKYTPISARHTNLKVSTSVSQRFDDDLVIINVSSDLDCSQKVANCLLKLKETLMKVTVN